MTKLADYECDGGCGTVKQFPADISHFSTTELIEIFVACKHCYNLCDFEPEDIPVGANIHWGWIPVGSEIHKAFLEGTHPMEALKAHCIAALNKFTTN